MKTIFNLFGLLLITNFVFSQNIVTPFEQELYDSATSRINALDYLDIEEGIKNESPEVVKFASKVKQKVTTEALDIFNQLLDTIPTTKLLNRINYDIARMYYRNGNTKIASEYFVKVLDNNDIINLKYESDENYTRNRICRTLAEIAIENKDYTTALKFLEDSKKYKIKFGCGNAAEESSEEIEKLYMICNNGIKEKK
jgi:tetratricopeptide (TPR) repeat protein